jgi:ABC-type bacteriocin/lantibiotic exporter with double-glycine peptidase domain
MKEIISTRKALRRLFKLLSQEREEVGHIYIFAVLSGIVALSLPLGIQSVVNLVMSAQLSTSWVLLVSLVIIGTLVAGLINLMQMAVLEKLQQKIFTKAAFELSYRFPKVRTEATYNAYLPELANRFFDTLTIQKGLSKIMLSITSGSVQIVFGLTLLFIYHPIFIVFGFFLIAIVIGILFLTFRAGLETNFAESKYKYSVAHWLEELGRNQMTFKLAASSNLPLSITDERVTKYLEYRKKHFRVLIIQGALLVLYKVLITGGLLILGSMLILDNLINIGQFVAAEIIIILILASVEKLIESMEPLYDVLTALEKIGYLTDLPLDKMDETREGVTIPTEPASLEIRNLLFQFPGRDNPTLDNISLQIQPGEKWCLHGANGSGKSVLLQMVAGMYEDYKGSIMINGLSTRNIDMGDLHRILGAHFNREHLFEGTLRDNILLKRPWLIEKDLSEILQITGLELDIADWKEGYNTFIMSDGKNLPQSIVAKILLCRALVGKPPVLLLEDNLHFMQPQEADRILRHLTNCSSTVLFVSRRQKIVDRFRNVVEMEEGRINYAGPNPSYTELN